MINIICSFLSAEHNKISMTLADILPHGEDIWYPKLNTLNLEYNKIQGTIPATLLDKAPQLRTLSLGHNLICGVIPEKIVCYDSTCGADCKNKEPSFMKKTLDEYKRNNQWESPVQVYYAEKGCKVLELYCGDPTTLGDLVRENCPLLCGTTLQQLQVHSNQLESPLPPCLSGDGESEERGNSLAAVRHPTALHDLSATIDLACISAPMHF